MSEIQGNSLISAKILKLKKEKNISIEELAHNADMSKGGLYNMIKKGFFSVDGLQKIANALDVDIKYFFDDTGSFPSSYNDLKNENENYQALLRVEQNKNELLYFMVNELLHFVLSNTYYNELIDFVKPPDYAGLQIKIAKRIKVHKPYTQGHYIPFDHDTVLTIINFALFEHPAIAQAFEKKKIKNDLLVKQYAAWKATPPQYPETKD